MKLACTISGLASVLALLSQSTVSAADVKEAIAVFKPAAGFAATVPGLTGTATFSQEGDGDVILDLDIKGMEPNKIHGIHIHQFGDSTDTTGLGSLGQHFIPNCVPDQPGIELGVGGNRLLQTNSCEKDQLHGMIPDEVRQPGDLGNIQTDAQGNFVGQFVINHGKVSLTDPIRSVLGRSIVIHENADKGKDFQPFGEAGDPYGYGIIGIKVPTVAADTNIAKTMEFPLPTAAVCEFIKYGDTDKAFGLARLSFYMIDSTTNIIRLKGYVEGLSVKKHSFHFHDYGDTTGPPEILGPVYNPNSVDIEFLDVTNEAGRTEFDLTFEANGDAMMGIIGRSLTIHDGELYEDPTIARAICGVTLTSDPNPLNEKTSDTGAASTTTSNMAALVASMVASVWAVRA